VAGFVLVAGTFFTVPDDAGAEVVAPAPPLLEPLLDAGVALVVGIVDCCAKVIPANKTSDAIITLSFFMAKLFLRVKINL
jgi:hypothetical protein